MTSETNLCPVSSLPSIISSIDNDRQVYRWFLMFISLPGVRQKLFLQDKTKNEYQALKRVQTLEMVTYLVMALIVLASGWTKEPWALLLEILPIIALVLLFQKNRANVQAISKQFLLENIKPADLQAQSLYQTCEYLSKQYSAPSLVDIITFQDFIGRKMLLGSIIFLPFIALLKNWQVWGAVLLLYLATQVFVNSSIVLRRLK